MTINIINMNMNIREQVVAVNVTNSRKINLKTTIKG